MLNKAIKFKKEFRKPFKGSKQFDVTCRNHGSCSYCESNRKHSKNVSELASKDKLKDYFNGIDAI
jgi:positive regulator of sigma E activity